jgi:anti-sigma-K factor RskA
MKHQVNVLSLEKYLLGELPEKKAKELETLLQREPALKVTLEEMDRSSRDFLDSHPAERVVPVILSRYAREISSPRAKSPSERSRPWKRFLLLSPAAAAAAALALLLVFHPWGRKKVPLPALDTTPDTTIVKGLSPIDLTKTQLLVFRRRGEQAELVKNGQWAREGDLFQLAYVSGAERYGLILSLDGRGRVTRHFPMPPGKPCLLELNTKILLPVAIELDDAPRFERFFFITSPYPIDVEDVLRRAADLAGDPDRAAKEEIDLPSDCHQSSLIVYKGRPQ